MTTLRPTLHGAFAYQISEPTLNYFRICLFSQDAVTQATTHVKNKSHQLTQEAADHSFCQLDFLYNITIQTNDQCFFSIQKHNLCSQSQPPPKIIEKSKSEAGNTFEWCNLILDRPVFLHFLPPCKEQYYVLLILTLKWPEGWNFSRFCLCENPQIRSVLVLVLHHVHTLTHNSLWYPSLTYAHTNKHMDPPLYPFIFLKPASLSLWKFTQHHFTFLQLRCTEDWF